MTDVDCTVLPAVEESLRRWKAELAVSTHREGYSIETAIDRGRIFSKTDRGTRDESGNPILFGHTYFEIFDGKVLYYDVVGLDLRSYGYVVAWDVQNNRYTCVLSNRLTRKDE